MVEPFTPVIKHVILQVHPAEGDRLATYRPQDPRHFGVRLHLLLGEDEASEACDAFDVFICTPSWFAAQVAAHGLAHFQLGLTRMPDEVAPGSGIWFVERWDQGKINEAILVVIEQASPGPDFDTVACRIGRLIPWEFDYRYDDGVNKLAGLPRPGSRSD